MKKKFVLLMVFLWIGIVSAEAQQRRSGGQRMDPEKQAKATADQWQEKFGLSDDQRDKAYTLVLDNVQKRRTKMRELMASRDREAIREAIAGLQEEMDEGLRKVFNETQWAAYEKWKEENPPTGRRRGGGR